MGMRATNSLQPLKAIIIRLQIFTSRGTLLIKLVCLVLLDSGAAIRNLGVTDVDVTGDSKVGGLVGENGGTITASYSTGSVNGGTTDNTDASVGGLVGSNSGTITASYSAGSATGNSYVGGLVGGNSGTITASYSTGSVMGNNKVGGLDGV